MSSTESPTAAVGVTGGSGFLGWHTSCRLLSLGVAVRLITRPMAVTGPNNAADGLGAVIHLAGVNRGTDDEIRDGNREACDQLIDAIRNAERPPTRVVYADSIQSSNDSVYGLAKREVGDRLRAFCDASAITYSGVRIPNVFGEGGRPFYNSFVATFCHQIAHGETPTIQTDREVPLVHAQEVADALAHAALGNVVGVAPLAPTVTSVREVLRKLTAMHATYADSARIPRLESAFETNLFNTLRSSIYTKYGPTQPLKLNTDQRGWLVETVKAETGGQVFVSSTVPGVTRGQHYHLRKLERFVVLQGTAEICMRRLFSGDVQRFAVTGAQPMAVEIPTLHTHQITNTGTDLVLTLFWSNEIFDPNRPDTYALSVYDGNDR